jgi:hypothetical protein
VTDDIISRIDAATGCQQCGKSLDLSPSQYFCGESCQRTWHSRRSISLPIATQPLGYVPGGLVCSPYNRREAS